MSDRQKFTCHTIPLCEVCAGQGRTGRAAQMERPTADAAKGNLRLRAGTPDKAGEAQDG